MTSDRTKPVVSVVITTRNRARVLDEALASVFAVDRTTFDLEVIVVNDGSTDATPSVIERYPVTVIETTGVGMALAPSPSALLEAGMRVEADLMHETRPLYEWVLEPLFAARAHMNSR